MKSINEINHKITCIIVICNVEIRVLASNNKAFATCPVIKALEFLVRRRRLYNVGEQSNFLTDPMQVKAVIDWSKAFTYETGNEEMCTDLTLAEGSGYYIWRVRPIYNCYTGGIANDLNWGVWSTVEFDPAEATMNGDTVTITNTNIGGLHCGFYYNQFDEDINWIYNRNFSEGEEGTRIAEAMKYADNLLHVRQEQRFLGSHQNTVVKQTILDNCGRPTLNTLPVPIDIMAGSNNEKFSYVEGLVKYSNGTNTYLYTADHFDKSSGTSNNFNNPLPINSGDIYNYYDMNSSQVPNIPSSLGYPFTRVLYTQDGTQRVKEQSLAGAEFRIGGSTGGKDRTIKTLYSSVDDDELVPLFGDETPVDTSVHKTITIDQNKVASITYQVKDGTIIASCLNINQGDTLLQDLPMTGSSVEPTLIKQINDDIKEMIPYGDNAFKSSKLVSFVDETTNVNIIYQKRAEVLQLSECYGLCTTCDYVIKINVRNTESKQIVASAIFSNTVNSPDSCLTVDFDTSFTIALPRGTYEFEKIIIGNNKIPGSETITFLDRLKLRADSTLRANINNDIQLENIKGWLDTDSVRLVEFYQSLTTAGWTYNAVDTSYYFTRGCCDTFKIPYKKCNECDDYPANFDFEAYLFDKWCTELGKERELNEFFLRNGLPLYAGTGNGKFNEMIAHMLVDNQCTCYDSCTLWRNWRSIVETYDRTAYFYDTTDTRVSENKDFDLLETFLSYVGTCYQGVSNHPDGDNTGLPPGEYGWGYLEYAYKSFKYVAEDNVCEELNDIDILNGSTVVNLQPWVPDVCGHNTNTNYKRWARFYSCITNHGRTPVSDSLKQYAMRTDCGIDCIDSIRNGMVDTCEKKCEEKYDIYVKATKDYFHKRNKIIQGDYNMYGTEITTNYDIPLKEVYCIAQALVEDCKSMCGLDIIYDGGNPVGIGTEQQIADYTKAMYYVFELDSVLGDSCCAGQNERLVNTDSSLSSSDYPYGVARFLNYYINDYIRHLGFQCSAYYKNNQVLTNNCNRLSYVLEQVFKIESCSLLCDSWPPPSATSKESNNAPQYYIPDVDVCGPNSDYTLSTCPDKIVDGDNNLDDYDTRTTVFEFRYDIDYEFYILGGCQLWLRRTCGKETFIQIDSVLICPNICCGTGNNAKFKSALNDLQSTPGAGWDDSSGCNCETTICIKYKPFEIPDSLSYRAMPLDCEKIIGSKLLMDLESQIEKCVYINGVIIDSVYRSHCLSSEGLLDFYRLQYMLGYYHYTLYYYDRAGNLVRTIPPKGVSVDTNRTRAIHPAHTYESYYRYNSLKQLVEKKSPDTDQSSSFYYNEIGQLRFSQDAAQKLAERFSYTVYDKLGRIVESGEATLPAGDVLGDNTSFMDYPQDRYKLTKITTVYSEPATFIPAPYTSLVQRYLQNRVSYTRRINAPENSYGCDIATYYSYDPHGNVEWVIQNLPMGIGFPTDVVKIDYEYDLISGNVLQVSANKGFNDQFFWHYKYDEDNRITKVETSRDCEIWDRDASYSYYGHGPLQRIEVGDDNLQGIDYAYTINGWLKAINQPNCPVNPPDGDGGINDFASDEFGTRLNYFSGDFRTAIPNLNLSPLAGSPLYNGNISSWEVGMSNLAAKKLGPEIPRWSGEKYSYDVLNRLKSSGFHEIDTSAYRDWAAPTMAYRTRYDYDPNGNALKLDRRSRADIMDSLTFWYNTGNNRLNRVTDIPYTTISTDIEPGQAANNYVYDASGNLVYDAQEGIDSIKWTPDGKVGRVVKNNNSKIEYSYDARGDRVVKAKYINGSLDDITFYIRDANGLVLCLYESQIIEEAVQQKKYSWQIYGAQGHDRFGKVTPKRYLQHDISPPDTTMFLRTLRQKFYEHKDHLGNVRMTFSDMKNRTAAGIFYLDSLTVYDYYPYGMLKPDRYYEDAWSRYGFNGMEKDDDVKGEGNSYDYGFRMYDPRTIRFYSIDPLTEKFPFYSPFQFAGNNPIQFIDLDGLEPAKLTGSSNLIISIKEDNGTLDEEEMKDESGNWDYVVVKNIEEAKDLLQKQYGDNIGFINNLVISSHGVASGGPQLDSDFNQDHTKNPIGNKSMEYVRSLLTNSANVLFTGCGIIMDFNNNKQEVKKDKENSTEVALNFSEFFLKNSNRNLFFNENFTMGRVQHDDYNNNDAIDGGDTWSVNFNDELVSSKSTRGTGFMWFLNYSERKDGPSTYRSVLYKTNYYDIIINSDGFLEFEKLEPVEKTPVRDNPPEKKKE